MHLDDSRLFWIHALLQNVHHYHESVVVGFLKPFYSSLPALIAEGCCGSNAHHRRRMMTVMIFQGHLCQLHWIPLRHQFEEGHISKKRDSPNISYLHHSWLLCINSSLQSAHRHDCRKSRSIHGYCAVITSGALVDEVLHNANFRITSTFGCSVNTPEHASYQFLERDSAFLAAIIVMVPQFTWLPFLWLGPSLLFCQNYDLVLDDLAGCHDCDRVSAYLVANTIIVSQPSRMQHSETCDSAFRAAAKIKSQEINYLLFEECRNHRYSN